MTSVFIDGAAGTTGLMIRGLMAEFAQAHGIEIVEIADRKNVAQRRTALNDADISILCLPDAAAREAVSLVTSAHARILDASSAHRTTKGWTYGFPEMSAQQPELIANANRVTNPGCYAVGAVAILRPLVDAGIIDPQNAPIIINGISGYSGSGKEGIQQYRDSDYARDNTIRIYGLNRMHKHVPEIQHYSKMGTPPVFLPVEIKQEQGMIVNVPLSLRFTEASSLQEIHDVLSERYNHAGSTVHLQPLNESMTIEDINLARFARCAGDASKLFAGLNMHVTGWRNDYHSHCVVFSEFDNLGKGASAQAVQNLKLMLKIA